MNDNTDEMETSAQSPTVTVESTYRTRGGEKTETFELDNYEVERLLEVALRDSLDGVDARTVAEEVRARGREQ